MGVYYPLGKPIIPTEKEMNVQKRKFELFDYYGIPYGQIDDMKETESQKDLERLQASIIIMKGEDIPPDLAERLLRYKENDANGSKNTVDD